MSTAYSSIYDRFLSKIHDYELAELSDSILENELLKFLKSSISEFKYCTKDLSDRDDIVGKFNIVLTELEQEVLAKQMVIQWINPKLYREENISNILSPKDYQSFSPANLLDKLTKLKNDMKSEVNTDLVYYYYNAT